MKRYKILLPWILFFISAIVLFISSHPTIGWWDSGAYAANANDLSTPDPGGSVFFVILGRLFITVFFFLPKIKALTLLSIFSTSLASVFLFFTLTEVLNHFDSSSKSELKIIVSFITALSLPFLYSIWIESNVARVYTLGLLLTSILLLCAVKVWFAEEDKEKLRWFLLIIYLMTIDYSTHRLNMPFIPVVILLMIFPLRRFLLKVKYWLHILLLIFIGLSIQSFFLLEHLKARLFIPKASEHFQI